MRRFKFEFGLVKGGVNCEGFEEVGEEVRGG